MNSNLSQSIIIDPEVLEESHMPEVLVARQAQLQEAKLCLEPATRAWKPTHSWFYGPPGAGKTTTIKYLLREFQENENVRSIYVNCDQKRSLYSIVDYIVRELRLLRSSERGASFKLEALGKYVDEKPLVVALDEIHLERNCDMAEILYALASLGKLGLACISPNRQPIALLDESALSRLGPKLIEFPRYTFDQLLEILEYRARRAIAPNACDEEIHRRIAELAEGDARVAIQTLKGAALRADKEDGRIKLGHVETSFCGVKGLRALYGQESLGIHHRLAYQIVKEHPWITGTDLIHTYRNRCREQQLQPVSRRTLQNYLNALISKGSIVQFSSGLRGGTYVYKIAD